MASATPGLTWEQYQALPPDQRRRPLTAREYAALTPAQLAAAGLAEPSEGAPANFNGPVFPNPDHIAPALDTDPSIPVTRLPQGVQFDRGNWQGSPAMDVSNPAAADIAPIAGREISAQMGTEPIKLPPGATLETSPDQSTSMKLPPGATLEQPAAPPDQPGILDREIPLDSTLHATESGLQSLGRGFRDVYNGTKELFKPAETKGEQAAIALGPAGLPLYRMLKSAGHTAEQALQIAGAVHDINSSADPTGTYLKMAQEDAGGLAAQALTAAATEGATRVLPKVVDAVTQTPKAVAAAPVRLAARTAETALNQKLVPLRKIANLMTPADEAEALNVKVPGRDLGLAKPAPKPAAELDATGENKPFAGGLDEPITKPARELDATGENRPFAGGLDEPKPAAKPAAPAAAPKPAPQPAPAAEAPAAAPKRSIVTDPKTGQPEFSDVIAKRQQITDKLSDIAQKIQEQEKAEAASSAEPKPQPKTTAPRVPEANEDLTNLMKESIGMIEAQKGGVYTSAAPGDLAKRWGVDENSISDTDANVRGLSKQQSQAYIDQLADSYKKGRPVQPVMETRDAGNNITSVDGRHRALAAQKAGIERIPVIVRRMPAAPAQP